MARAVTISNKEIEDKIYLVRGLKVMLDSDLADMYGVSTKRLNEQVKRNKGRFPKDFMFQLTTKEWTNLRSQIATSSEWGGRRILPYVFSEHGVLMLSSVLNSRQAIAVNIQIMRIFTKIREMLVTNKDVVLKREQIERKMMKQDELLNRHEEEIQVIFDALKQLLTSPGQERKPVGYRRSNDKS
jgi:hypothetical protein